MPYEFKTTRRVAFRETDAAGIVHFANFFVWMEDTEHAFFRSLGFSIHEGTEGHHVGWPRVGARCEFSAPLNFEDEIEVHLIVKEKRRKSLTYQFVISKLKGDSDNGMRSEKRDEAARGELTVVCVAWDEITKKMKAVAIPEEISSKIEVAPPGAIA